MSAISALSLSRRERSRVVILLSAQVVQGSIRTAVQAHGQTVSAVAWQIGNQQVAVAWQVGKRQVVVRQVWQTAGGSTTVTVRW